MPIATRITNAFYRLASWAVIKCASRYPDPRAILVDATYKEIERKAQRVAEVNEMISELEDARITLVAAGEKTKTLLHDAYKAARTELVLQLVNEHLLLDDLMAEAAEALVAANEDYAVTVEEASKTLGIEVHE